MPRIETGTNVFNTLKSLVEANGINEVRNALQRISGGVTFEDAMERVLELARATAATTEDNEACNQVEDFIVNQLGED